MYRRLVINIQNNKNILVFPTVIFSLAIFSIISLNPVFADIYEVSIPEGTSVLGCEKTSSCYNPYKVTVHPRDDVLWTNDDTAAHTVTSGTPDGGPDGKFDSSLIMAGGTFSYTFDTLGEYPYFCIVHPWMEGMVFVTVGGGVEIPLGTIVVGGPDAPKETVVHGLSSDGKVRVEVVTTEKPTVGKPISFDVRFRDASGGGMMKHTNYELTITQDGSSVLSATEQHVHEGVGKHSTKPLDSDKPLDISVNLLGFGLPDNKANWTGPKGEMMSFQIVPEFGSIAMIILAISIVSIVLVRPKTLFTKV